MPFEAFHILFPEIGDDETRTIILPDGGPDGLPADSYTFLELFCTDKNCDCRRVMLSVVSEKRGKHEAVISFGWESRSFYEKWLNYPESPEMIDLMKGPDLNMGSPATELAPVLLDMFKTVLLEDEAYMDRVKRHYRMVRDKVGGRNKPIRHALSPGDAKKMRNKRKAARQSKRKNRRK